MSELLRTRIRSRMRQEEKQWRAAEELLSALVSEASLGQQPREAFAAVSRLLPDSDLHALRTAQRVNQLGGNPCETLATAQSTQLSLHFVVLALAFDLCIRTGSSFVPPLQQSLSAVRSHLSAAALVAEETSGVRLSSMTLMALPLTGPLYGPMLSSNPLSWLFGTNPGRVLLVVGLGLELVAWRWTRAIITNAVQESSRVSTRTGSDADLSVVDITQLLAMAFSAGTPLVESATLLRALAQAHPNRTLAMLARQLACGAAWSEIESDLVARDARWQQPLRILSRCVQTGASPGPLLFQLVDRWHEDSKSARVQRVRRAGVWALLPLTLCGLPAFFILTVIPLIASYLSGFSLTTQ